MNTTTEIKKPLNHNTIRLLEKLAKNDNTLYFLEVKMHGENQVCFKSIADIIEEKCGDYCRQGDKRTEPDEMSRAYRALKAHVEGYETGNEDFNFYKEFWNARLISIQKEFTR